MEFPVFSSFQAVSKVSFCPFSSKQICQRCFFRRRKLKVKWSCNSKSSVRIMMSAEKDSSSNGYGGRENGGTKSGSGFIEVIGIGSRKDAVFDFCSNSSFQLSSLRFWNIIMKESQEVQLQLRSAEEEPHPRIVKVPPFMKSCSKAIILVASAGYGLDHNAAVDIVKTMRSASGLTVAIIMKPFSFEGLRRRDEVKALIGKLKENTDLLIEIDIDALLKKDLVTLDEAVKTANNAVLLAINAISVLASENHRKLSDGLHEGIEEVSVSEINKILGTYKEAKIGFGAAFNIKTSILQSIFDCPFLGVGLKDTNSIIVCIVTSSVPMNDKDIVAFLCTFRKTTEYTREIIISTIHEPNLEPNLLITTVLSLGLNVQQSSQSGGILSRLAQHFPLVFSFWGRQHQQPTDTSKENAVEISYPSDVIGSYDFDEGTSRIATDVIDDSFSNYIEALEPEPCINSTNLNPSRNSEQNKELFDSIAEDSNFYDAIAEGGNSAFQREQLVNWNLGPGFEVAQEWAKERAANATPMIDNLSIFQLPVGVRPSKELEDCSKVTFMTQQQEPETENNVDTPISRGMPSWSALTDAGLEAMMEIASSLLNGKYTDKSKKQGVLSVRAASMLETERDFSKKWTPIVEMQYRGGMYKGRCQGGLPEGKGRLVLDDGSIYDGLWRYGKRSGPGIFYLKNGDVFQGSWRDDIIHGKGWFYFHTGDRWFANFWKGKANGEGRFYTKTGDAFFGNFKDGWRHGEFLCISANGTRYVEIWEQGVLLDSKRIEEDAKDIKTT